MPPVPDRLYYELGLSSPREEYVVVNRLRSLMSSLERTTAEERRALFAAFTLGCPTALPQNIHISLDLLRRDLGMAPAEVVGLLKDLRSLGFDVEVEHGHNGDENEKLVVIEWHDQRVYDDDEGIDDPLDGSILDSECGAGILSAVISIVQDDRCNQCIADAIEHLDFGFLASVTLDTGH